MKILYLSTYSFPEHVASPYLSQNRDEAFAKKGFVMECYSPTPTRGVTAEIRFKYKNVKVEKFYNGMYTLHRFSMYREGKHPLLRAIRYLLVCIRQFNRAVFCAKDIDIMFLTSTPPIQGAMGAIVKMIKGYKFVYNLQDVFPDSLVGAGLAKKNGFLWKIGRALEDFTYKHADKIIVVSQDFKKNIMNKGVPENKIEVIYNWVDEQKVVNVKRSENVLFDEYNLDRNKFYITYCGNIGLTQNMDMLIDVAKDLEVIPNIHFVLIGEGVYKSHVESVIEERQINNITLLPFQPYEKISQVFSLGDVGIVISKPNVGQNSVPSKTWSILSASRPVLVNFDENELKTIIENNQCGIYTKAGDRDAFKSAILYLYQNKEKCKKIGENGRKFILENLTKEIGTSKYIKVLEDVMNS